ncbi:MAG: hypothetical protein ACK5KL_02650 [Dysgonomonas sp.]
MENNYNYQDILHKIKEVKELTIDNKKEIAELLDTQRWIVVSAINDKYDLRLLFGRVD